MIIKKINAGAFGKLKNLEIKPEDGFNVIYGENGSGKSTLMSFIKAVFYGGGSGKERASILPWDGTLPFGSVTYENDGRDFVAQMKLGKTAKGDKFSVFDNLSGEEVHEGAIGQSLFKMGETTFKKTAFISSEGSEISQRGEDEIAEKLANLSSSGDEGVSYNKAFSAVDDYMARLIAKRGRGGRITQLEDSIEELKGDYAASLSGIENSAAVRESLEGAKKDYRNLLEEIKALKSAEESAVYQKTKSFMNELESLGEEKDVSGIDELAERISTLNIKLCALTEKESIIPSEKNSDKTISDSQFESISELFYSKSTSKKSLFVMSLILSVAFLALGLLRPWLLLGVPVFLITAFALRPGKQNKPLMQKLSSFGFSDYESFKACYMEQKALKAAYEKNATQRNLDITETKKLLEEACIEAKKSFGTSDAQSLRNIKQTEERRKTLKSSVSTLLSGRDFSSLSEKYKNSSPLSFDVNKLREKEEALEALNQRIISLERTLGTADGAFVPPDEIKRRIDELSEKKAGLSYTYDVLSEIQSTLHEAYEIMEGEFGEKLNSAAGEILKGITQSYDCPRISKSFQIKLPENEGLHDAKEFSTGVYQQVFLSFRLSMMSLMDSPSPVFLDDSAMTYDDLRAENLIKFLKEYSKSRQVFLFTCRRRDMELAEKYGAKCFEINIK